MKKNKKVVILGDGLLGKEIHNQTNWSVLSRKQTNFDIADLVKSFPKDERIDVIVNCIANTDTYSEDEISMMETNYIFPISLIKFCGETGKKLIHISTDYVYANSPENASESDVPSPYSNWYSVTKLLADVYIKSFSNNYLICRLSHKPYPFPYDSAWGDVYTNADYTPVISDLVITLIKNGANGIYNVGTKTKTIYDLALKTKGKEIKKIDSPSYVPKNVTMNISKLENFLLTLKHD